MHSRNAVAVAAHVCAQVLTKAAMMAPRWLDAYTNEMPQEILTHVREHKNCEDVAMQYLVSNRTGIPPQYARVSGCAPSC